VTGRSVFVCSSPEKHVVFSLKRCVGASCDVVATHVLTRRGRAGTREPTTMKCKACGSELTTVERQLRAADEATQTVTSCPSCPVKAWMIKITEMPKQSSRGFRFPVKRAIKTQQEQILSPNRTRYVISVDVQESSLLNNILLSERHVVIFDHSAHTRSLSEGSVPARAETTVKGPRVGERSTRIGSTPLGFGADLLMYNVQESRSSSYGSKYVLLGHYAVVDDISGHKSVLYKAANSTNVCVLVDTDHSCDSRTVAKVVDVLYNMKNMPFKLSLYMQPEDIARLNSLSARAWDTSRVPESRCKFTSKPDGERMWLVIYGRCWYSVSKSKEKTITKWLMTFDSTMYSEEPVVLDVEYLSGFGFILIDCLTTITGQSAPISRDIAWVTRTFERVTSQHPSCPAILRKYSTEHEDAVKYANEVPYIVDGIIAIRDGSTEILKIKDTKSIELRHLGNGEMCTSDSTVVMILSNAEKFPTDSIVEVRFKASRSAGEFDVETAFVRTDKTTANSTDAAVNIFQSSMVNSTRDDDERRKALLWCNKLRESIVHRALKSSDTKHIVLDVGTGTGQSVDSLLRSDSVSYILVEPDRVRCNQLKRRLGGVKVLTNPRDVVPLVRQLKTRSIQHVVVNSTLSDFYAANGVSERVMPELKCILCTFSIQYITSTLFDISETHRIPIYGCCYTYDSVGPTGTLIDTAGVVMKMIDDDLATVKWGNDKEYTEPVVNARDLHGLGSVVLGSDIISLADNLDDEGCRSICSKITVVLP